MTARSDDEPAPGSWIEHDTVTTAADELAAIDALLRRPAWHAQAACRGQGPDAWFPTRHEDASAARAVCECCPVRAQCAEAGVSEPWGLWGGMSARARKPLRRAAAAGRREARRALEAEIVRTHAAGVSLRETAARHGVSLSAVTTAVYSHREQAVTRVG